MIPFAPYGSAIIAWTQKNLHPREAKFIAPESSRFYYASGDRAIFAAEGNAVGVLLAAEKPIQIGGIALVFNLLKRSIGKVIHIFRFFTPFDFDDDPCALGSHAVVKNDVGETVAGLNVGSQIIGTGAGTTEQSCQKTVVIVW